MWILMINNKIYEKLEFNEVIINNSLFNMFRDIIIFYYMIYWVFYLLNIIFFLDFWKKFISSYVILL